jgi:hypothetical protein
LPVVEPGNPLVGISTGTVDGPLAARALDHIWVSKKANWLNLGEIDALPKYDTEPSSESHRQSLMGPLNPQ